MAARSKARKRAVDVLYEAELRGTDPLVTLAARAAAADPPVPAYTGTLVEGVTRHRDRIDALLEEHSVDWPLSRMPAVDRSVLRVGVYELLWRDDVPDPVAVDEAVELAKALAGEDTPGFVNGVLGRLLRLKPTLAR